MLPDAADAAAAEVDDCPPLFVRLAAYLRMAPMDAEPNTTAMTLQKMKLTTGFPLAEAPAGEPAPPATLPYPSAGNPSIHTKQNKTRFQALNLRLDRGKYVLFIGRETT